MAWRVTCVSERAHPNDGAFCSDARETGKGSLKGLPSAFVGAPAPVHKMRLLASEAGEGRTRLTVLEWGQGEGPDGWAHAEAELERWVVEELGGARWPLEPSSDG